MLNNLFVRRVLYILATLVILLLVGYLIYTGDKLL